MVKFTSSYFKLLLSILLFTLTSPNVALYKLSNGRER